MIPADITQLKGDHITAGPKIDVSFGPEKKFGLQFELFRLGPGPMSNLGIGPRVPNNK